MGVEILDDANPSLDTLRWWGYDEQLLLLEQDEDVILSDMRYIPVLLELAADPACPKRYYALTIVKNYCQFLLAGCHLDVARPMTWIAEEASCSPSLSVREWAGWFQQSFVAMEHKAAQEYPADDRS